mmetsp:Transcript_11467/g.12581  ORF Transcript_11467/g.12581 Transcript_11467/m.12581 type:complete len:342 (+) Transcript_11467:10-1035(+)
MFDPSELAKKKNALSKTEPLPDRSINLGAPEIDVVAYQKKMVAVNIEHWINELKGLTFETEFYPLSEENARVLMKAYDLKQEKKPFTQDVQTAFNEIETGLQKVIDSVRGADTKVFVKTSSRSAKDTVIYAAQFESVYKECLKKLKEQDMNAKVVALMQAGTLLLATKNAKELLENFVLSERVYIDMRVALNLPEQFSENFAVRKWIDIDVDMEFRGFVYDNKLTQLSQYNHLPYFERLIERKDELLAKIVKFYEEKVMPRLKDKFTAYVVDFAITGENYDQLWVIELNPFEDTTDGAMFSWQKERDLLLGKKPFEFRLKEKKDAGIKAAIMSSWRKFIEE